MTPEELKIIKERCNKATPGPWRACQEGTCSCSQIWSQSADVPVAEVTRVEWGDPGLPYGEIPEKIAEANSLFIAYAREDIPKLLVHIKELESRLPRWIPKKERLPEESGYYLCWNIGAIESMIPYADVYYFDKERQDFEPDADLCISHWQPLPKGPEE